MTAASNLPTLSDGVVLAWRVAVALGLLWTAALGAIVTSQRADGGDAHRDERQQEDQAE